MPASDSSTRAAASKLPTELAGIELDPERAAQRKAQRLFRLNAVTIPGLRFLGFGALSLAIYLYLRFFSHRPDAARIALVYAAVAFVYCAIAAVILRVFYQRLPGDRLAVTFLALDVILQLVAIYLTGGEESWLVALLLLRMGDQATSGRRRALFFTHWNVLCFLGLTAYLALGEGRALDWPREMTKAGLLYAAGWWIAVSASGGDRRRRQVSAAIGATRRMIHQMEAQTLRLDEAKARAEAASQAKSQFLANMSHELRTPLSAVIGIADLLEQEELSAHPRELVTLLQTSAGSLLHIVDDVLDFSKIEAGKLAVEARPCQLAEVVKGVVQLLEHRAEEKGVDLRCTVPADIPPVLSDPARVRQVLLNLVGNAVKFTPRGWVEVRLRELHRDREQLRLRIEVEDTGIGIAETQQRHLFEPFTQADATSTRRYGGTGLGLAMVQRLVDLMGGRVGVRSRPGAGSTFWVELPLPRLAPEANPPSASEAPAVAVRGKPRVLLVEDNPVNSAVAEAVLLGLGATVETASDGREAVESTTARSFDLILMDCQMPNMDGYEATREIRRQEREAGPEARRTPIVALTAHALADDRRRCLAAGMDDHLAKPVRRETLTRVLAACHDAGSDGPD